jgi:tartrate/fumarate subfamily iron-sulfur-dependent hydro-lyase beta chain
MEPKLVRMPMTEADARALRAGDEVKLTGVLYTGRDAVHRHLYQGGACPVDLRGGVIYHCGPVVLEENGGYRVVAAGPTTSIREEPYQADVIEKFGLRGVIGKGGMGKKTLEALGRFGAVYLHAIGGAAQVYARTVKKVEGVYLKKEFGSPEAIWVFDVVDFPCVVTMDSHGKSLHAEVLESSLGEMLKKL